MIRFLGTTPRSSNVRALLTSLCGQLRRAYGKEAGVPSEFQDLRAYFAAAVKEWPSAEQPLTLFIDSVDQLDDSNGGRRLEWLPVTGLPPHVKLVVSTLPDYPEFQCLTFLKGKLEGIMHSQVVEVATISEPEMVLMHLLRLQGRTLTDGQLRHVLDAFDKRTDADAAGTPLWLTIVAQAPRLAAYIPRMRERLAAELDVEQTCANVKATTEEGLGFTGQKQGIAAHAVVLLVRDASSDRQS